MGSTYLACRTLSCKIFPDVVPFTLNCRGKVVESSNLIRKGSIHKNGLMLSSSSFLPLPLERNRDRNHRSILLAKFEDRDSEAREEKDENKEDDRAMEAVLGLYSALKKNDVHGLADVLSEECRCMSNFTSGFRTLQGKQQVIEFFNALVGSLGENVQFIVKPTLRDGLGVGVAWKLECSKTHVPLGKGFGFHVCHEYEGKVLIRNVEMFMEPLFNMEPLRLKLIPLFTAAIMTIPGCTKLVRELSKANKGIYVFLSLLLMVMSLFFLKLSLS